MIFYEVLELSVPLYKPLQHLYILCPLSAQHVVGICYT